MVGAPVFEGRNVLLQVQFLGKKANETQFVRRGQCPGIGKDFGERHGERMCHEAVASPILNFAKEGEGGRFLKFALCDSGPSPILLSRDDLDPTQPQSNGDRQRHMDIHVKPSGHAFYVRSVLSLRRNAPSSTSARQASACAWRVSISAFNSSRWSWKNASAA